MNPKRTTIGLSLVLLLLLVPSPRPAAAQDRPPAAENPVLKTPLPAKVLGLLANEISGQIIFNNEVKLAGAPWQREESEFGDTFYETRTIHGLVRGYGIETTRIDRFKSAATFEYPVRGELWMLKPETRLIARLEADPALVSRSSADADITGDLVYIPPLNAETLASWAKDGRAGEIQGQARPDVVARQREHGQGPGRGGRAGRDRLLRPEPLRRSRPGPLQRRDLRRVQEPPARHDRLLAAVVRAPRGGRAGTAGEPPLPDRRSRKYPGPFRGASTAGSPAGSRTRKASSSPPTSSRATSSAGPTTT